MLKFTSHMINSNHILRVLREENGPVELSKLYYLLGEYYPSLLGIRYDEFIKYLKENEQIYNIENGMVNINDRPEEIDPVHNSHLTDRGLDEYFKELSTLFLYHDKSITYVLRIVTLIFVDRLIRNHFSGSFIDSKSPKISFDKILKSLNPISTYRDFLNKMNCLEFFKGDFSQVIKDLETASTHVSEDYMRAFNICIKYSGLQFNKQKFGRKFNLFLTETLLPNIRGDNHVTQNAISKIIASQIDIKDNQTVYDPAVGIGSLIVEMAHFNNCYNFMLIGGDINEDILKLCKFNLILNAIYTINLRNQDSFEDQSIFDFSADIAICHPPWGALPIGARSAYRGFYPWGKDMGVRMISAMLQKTKPTGRIFTIINDRVLNSLPDKAFRKDLIEKGIVEKVISFPAGLLLETT